MFRKRSNPNNLEQLKKVETEYYQECDRAKECWINDTCSKIESIRDPKEKWREFKKLMSYQDGEVGSILPLLKNDEPIFEVNEKFELLRDVFFGGQHISGEVFDEDFKKEVDKKVEKTHENIKEEKGDEFLDRIIEIEETEAAIQRLKKGKAPGPDNIYGDLLKAADQELIEAVNLLFTKS